MGKAKKVKVSKGGTKEPKIGLAEQIEFDKTVKPTVRQKVRHRADEEEVSVLIFLFRIILILLSDQRQLNPLKDTPFCFASIAIDTIIILS